MMQVGLWIAGALLGTTVWAPSEEAVIVKADAIAVIDVVDVRVVRHSSGVVVQDVRADVRWAAPRSALNPKQRIDIQVVGGELNGLVTQVAGGFSVSRGERALVYLSRHKDRFRPWGLSYGWLELKDGHDGRSWLHRSLSGLRLVKADGSQVQTLPWQKRSLAEQLKIISKLRRGVTQ